MGSRRDRAAGPLALEPAQGGWGGLGLAGEGTGVQCGDAGARVPAGGTVPAQSRGCRDGAALGGARLKLLSNSGNDIQF